MLYKLENGEYNWILAVENKKDKKLYCSIQNAMTGECSKIFKYDYTGLNSANDGGFITRKDVEIKDSKLKVCVKEAEKILIENNILNSKNNSILEISLEDKFYIGVRPIVILNTKMKNGRAAEVTFYTDTDELVGVAVSY